MTLFLRVEVRGHVVDRSKRIHTKVQKSFLKAGNQIYLLIFVKIHARGSGPRSKNGSGSRTAKSMWIHADLDPYPQHCFLYLSFDEISLNEHLFNFTDIISGEKLGIKANGVIKGLNVKQLGGGFGPVAGRGEGGLCRVVGSLFHEIIFPFGVCLKQKIFFWILFYKISFTLGWF